MSTKVPAPTLDNRNGDAVTAQSIGALPSELSDRSDSNPAVVIIEAAGTFFDKLIYQINRWPSAVIQKCLSLIGITVNPAAAATVTQTFTLSAPQPSDTAVAKGTAVANSDGSLVFSTLSDLTVPAYITGTGTISLTSGSTTVTGSSSLFTLELAAGYQISTDKSTWYTVQSIASNTSLTLTAAASSTVAGSAYYGGAVSGTVQAQCTTTGSATNAAAATLTTLQTSPAGVSSTTNASAAAGGTDAESTTGAIARAPTAFAARDVACSASDYAYFAQQTLGTGGRATAQSNMNNATAASGYVTVALLSPAWTTTTGVTAQERASVVRDLAGRTFAGATTIDIAATIQTFTTAGAGGSAGTMFGCAVYRNAAYDAASVQVAIAKAINSYLSPNTYAWGRTIYPGDLVRVVEALPQVDRVANVNGVIGVGMDYCVVANNITFTNGSTSATGTAGDFANMTIGQTMLLDQTNGATYLVTNISGGTLTISPSYSGPSGTLKPAWFTSKSTTLTSSYTLPYSNLSIDTASPPASITIVGSV